MKKKHTDEPFINEDQLHDPCYHPLRNVWSVKIGYRKFEFATKKQAKNFHLKYCAKKSIIPPKHENEVECFDKAPEYISLEDKQVKYDIRFLINTFRTN